MKMSSTELNEAIYGAQYKEARNLKLLRVIAFMIGKYLGFLGKGTTIKKFYPLPFDEEGKDSKGLVKPGSPEWKAMEKRWEQIDKRKGRK